jgi:hypothetical protein
LHQANTLNAPCIKTIQQERDARSQSMDLANLQPLAAQNAGNGPKVNPGNGYVLNCALAQQSLTKIATAAGVGPAMPRSVMQPNYFIQMKQNVSKICSIQTGVQPLQKQMLHGNGPAQSVYAVGKSGKSASSLSQGLAGVKP